MLLTTVGAVFMVAEAFGLIRNPYAGLVAFIVVPAFFVLGLLLIPLGLWLEARRERRSHGHPRLADPSISGVPRSVVGRCWRQR